MMYYNYTGVVGGNVVGLGVGYPVGANVGKIVI